jgi:hypothetical protein
MKFFILASALFLSTSAFACPQISGHYTCKDELGVTSDTEEINISQVKENGFDKITLKQRGDSEGWTFVADGKKTKVGVTDFTAWCNDEKQYVAIHGLGRAPGRINSSLYMFSVKDNGKSLRYFWYVDAADKDPSDMDDIWDGRDFNCTKVEKN